ncbi:MAG: DUF3794 domain-containing protein [Clostridiales bacterium]|nr:DUF3794 domain-containing protein [Clostridiales bacterium]
MPENIQIKSDEITFAARGQAVVEARQPLEAESKVLSVSALATAVPSEIFAGEVRYMGKVRFDCIVLTDGKVECMQTVAEFSDKISSPLISAGTFVTLVPEVINVESSVENGTLKTVAVVDTIAVLARSNEYQCLVQTDDCVYAEKRVVDYCTVSAEQSETVYVTDSTSATKISEILCVTSRSVVTGAQASDGEVKVSGAVYSNVIVRTDDDTVSTCKIVTPFVKSISAMGASDGNTAIAIAEVDDATATLGAENNTIELAITMRVNVTAIECKHADAVVDVFCADNEIEPKTVEANCVAVDPLVTVIDTVDGQIPIAADRLAADNVLCVNGSFCTLSESKVEEGRVIVEGLVGGDIVYYNAEKNDVDTLSFRLPFSMPLTIHTDAANIWATATVTDVTVRVRRESVFDIKAEVAFTLLPSTPSVCSFVESVSMGAEIPRPDASVIVHIAKAGETLWQAAKALCCSPERVKQQNDAPAPYAGGERLINFCSKSK